MCEWIFSYRARRSLAALTRARPATTRSKSAISCSAISSGPIPTRSRNAPRSKAISVSSTSRLTRSGWTACRCRGRSLRGRRIGRRKRRRCQTAADQSCGPELIRPALKGADKCADRAFNDNLDLTVAGLGLEAQQLTQLDIGAHEADELLGGAPRVG